MTREVTRREAIGTGGLILAAATVPALIAAGDALAEATNDVAILEGAAGLEQTAVVAYTSAVSGGLLDPATTRVARLFAKQEQEHLDALTAALKPLGGKVPPAPKPADVKGLSQAKTAADILTFAIALEEMAVAAYYQAQQQLQDGRLLQTGASIMANEGQHLVVLRTAAGKPPVPNAFETGETAR